MGIILKARKVLKRNVLLQLYHSFVIPYLIYCVEIWGNASDITCTSLLQHRKKMLELLHSPHILLTQQLSLNNSISFLSNTYFF